MAARRVGWRGPEYAGEFPSLGWALIEHCEEHLVVPDGPRQGQPWRFNDEQARMLVKLYRIDPLTGRRLVRRACQVKPKKWGKGPEGAAWMLGETTGPCRFDGWDANGDPVAVPVWQAKSEHGGWSPHGQVAATSEGQTDNVFPILLRMLTQGSLFDVMDFDAGITRIIIDPGYLAGVIEPVTASAGSREGQRITAALCDETWQWKQANGGVRLADTIRRNLAGTSGVSLETTNAPEIGAGSVAEATIDAVQVQKAPGILLDYDEPKGKPPTPGDVEAIKRELITVYGETTVARGGWIDPERLLEEIQDPATSWVDALRFYLNRRVAGGGTWLSLDDWMACTNLDRRVAPGDLITLGFDGSKGESENADHTVLVGCRVSDGHLFPLLHLVPEQNVAGEWEIRPEAVDEALTHIFDTYEVWRLYADPPYYGPWLALWEARWPDRVIAWDTTKTLKAAAMLESLHTAVTQQAVSHNGHEAFAVHVKNAVRRVKGTADRPLTLIGKDHPHSPRKIDLAMAGALAFEARNDAVADGALNPKPVHMVGGF